MDGPRGYSTKRNKSEKDKYHMISHTCGIKKNKQTKQKQTHRYRELMVARWEEGWGSG